MKPVGRITEPPRTERTLAVELVEVRISIPGGIIFAEYVVRDADGNLVETIRNLATDVKDWATIAPKILGPVFEADLTEYLAAQYPNSRLGDVTISIV